MICKDVEFRWTIEGKEYFKNIKTSISQALVLRSPDFSRYFYLYTFSSDQSLLAVLTQKYDEKNEEPVSFMRTKLKGLELNYPSIEK
jgi:hypothetical protein